MELILSFVLLFVAWYASKKMAKGLLALIVVLGAQIASIICFWRWFDKVTDRVLNNVYGGSAQEDPFHAYRQRMWEEQTRQHRAQQAPDAYVVLGLSWTASPAEVREAWRKLAIQLHPDRHMHEPLEVRLQYEEQLKKVNAAYTLLKSMGKAA